MAGGSEAADRIMEGGAMLVGWVELWVGGGGFLRGMVGRGEECHRLNPGKD